MMDEKIELMKGLISKTFDEYNDNFLDTASLANNIVNQARIIEEQMIIIDVIEIYKGKYQDYNHYHKEVIKYNEMARRNNFSFPKESYVMSFMPEKNMLEESAFNFIRALALKEVQDA